jgi:hypothetical protein
MPRIHALLKPDGTVTMDAQDFLGASCAEATAQFEKALGLVQDRDIKPGFYVQDAEMTQEVSQ